MAAVDLDRIGRASLKELGDIRIDDVLSFIDRGIEKMPSYMDLYRRWESQQWSVGDIDFSLDRQDWLEASDLDRKATLWSHRLFFNGEERVTATLAPFVWAAPTPEIEVFLSTHPKDFDAFVEGITLYHIVIEATIALTGQRFELESMREQGLTERGFYRGFTAVARDESRHVSFGIKVLQEAVREDAARYAPLIQKTLVDCLPLITGT